MASASPPNFLFSVPVLHALLAPLALILSLLLLRWLLLAWAFRLPFVPARVSSSSSSPSVPTISPRFWTNHVFLSFRGEDTREKFVGHLYTALENMGIHTFKDDKKLSLGEWINPSLVKAIKESQIAIIVFSENYADSSWCLNELVCIMECKKETGLIVVPIFYDVEPSEVRKQKRKYGEAFARYESEKNPNLASWRKALVEACNLSGQDFNNKANMDEAELIKNIVNKISNMVRPLSPRVNNKLVGLETRMRDLISKLKIGSDGVLMIGLWGVGGGGKTTLASSVYKEISGEFDGCFFLENIREKSSKNDLRKLQEEILSGILKQDKVRVGSVEEGKDMIMDRLCRKKVLIVLDDLDQPVQLEALAGSLDWFGKGSRIIITTRDEGLLNDQNVVVQNITLLNEDEALRLFRKNAPPDDRTMEDYEQLSKEVVSYAGGLPLALRILGSFLRGKETNAWKSALARLKEIPNDNILETLKISFDGLTKLDQALFLDIACFHRWNDKDRAMEILDACGFHPVIGVEVLIQKALITISKSGEIDMHDLVQEMGHHIVRGDHRNNPAKHSRVWKEEDVLEICAMDATTDLDMIEAVRFKYNRFPGSRVNPLQHLPPFVANTKNLRWIDWRGNLASPMLTNFPQRTLRCLILKDSLQIQLWEGYKMLPNMKIIELSDLSNLIMTPNFDGLPNLERFILSSCRCLEEIHPSVGRLERLVSLKIEYCPRLMTSITQPKNLKTLSFEACPGIFERSEFQLNMDILPHNNMNHHRRLWFSHKDLTKLSLGWCDLGDEDIGSAVWELPNLQELDLSFNQFSRLDFSRIRLPRLKRLNVSVCVHLVELIELPPSIAVVRADYCTSLERVGDTSCCKWLWKVSHRRGYKLDPFDSERLLNSMLQGNAIEDYFISVALQHQIPVGFVGSFFRVKTFILYRPHVRLPPRTYPIPDDSDTFTLLLPDDWDNDFSGFLIRVVAQLRGMSINIIMKHDPDEEDYVFKTWQEEGDEEDSQYEHSHESDEAPEPEYDGDEEDSQYEHSHESDEAPELEVRTCVGYVSFSSLRRTTSFNSSYNIISFSIKSYWTSFSAELVPKRSKDDPLQTTKVAEFWYKKYGYQTSFTIQQDSNSSIEIHWEA